MLKFGRCCLLGLLLTTAIASQAQSPEKNPVQSSGTLVVVPAFGEVTHANDEVHATFMIEEQDKDKAAAASRVNQKMKQGIEVIKRQDPQATLKTLNYYTYPVYPEDQPRPATVPRQPTGWRVGQHLEVKTTNLDGLPKTVAAAQKVLALAGLQFGLSDATSRKLDAQRIDATYKNLNERITSIAKAMGRSANDAVLELVDFEGSGNYARPEQASAKMAMRSGMAQDASVAEPSFEPGETTLQMQVVGKVRFK